MAKLINFGDKIINIENICYIEKDYGYSSDGDDRSINYFKIVVYFIGRKTENIYKEEETRDIEFDLLSEKII